MNNAFCHYNLFDALFTNNSYSAEIYRHSKMNPVDAESHGPWLKYRHQKNIMEIPSPLWYMLLHMHRSSLCIIAYNSAYPVTGY